MNTDKKNQHYIPKFYLRNFSYQGNNKQIGVFNLKNEFYYANSPLKTQGSKNFFYGYDGVVEDILGSFENILSKSIKNIIESKILPIKQSDGHLNLLTFIALTHLRNPVAIQGMKNYLNEAKNRLLELDPTTDTKKFIPELSHDKSIKLALSNLKQVVKIMFDLDYKLLINTTSQPFICSDFPIIKYNQFLEEKQWKYGKVGYGSTGLQIFIPINSELIIVLYDPMIYKVGFKKRQQYEIINPNDVDKLNILQFVNCFETVYFNERASKDYIVKLFTSSKRYKRANQGESKLNYIIDEEEDTRTTINSEKNNLIIVGSTDCEIKMKIDGLIMHSGAKKLQLHPSLAQLRPWAVQLREDKSNF